MKRQPWILKIVWFYLRLVRGIMNSPLMPEFLRRVIVNNSMILVQPRPRDLKVTKLMLGSRPCLHIRSSESREDKVLYYLHGGGYQFCTPRTHRHMIYRMAREAKAQAFAIDYRLAPENPFPAALDDALAGYQDLLAQGFKAKNIIVGGDSAGGGLTLALLQIIRDEGLPLPAGAVCLSPWTDLTNTGETIKTNDASDPMLAPKGVRTMSLQYGREHVHSPLVSPLFGNFSGMPPIMIHGGEREILLDDSLRLKQKADENNWDIKLKVWPEMIHVFQFFISVLPDARRSIEELGQFMQDCLNSSQPAMKKTFAASSK